MASNSPNTGDHYRIDTPERVELEYDVASLGSRLIAAMVDTFLLAVLYVLLSILGAISLSEVGKVAGGFIAWLGLKLGQTIFVYAAFAMIVLMSFGVFWGYYLFFELFWHGQSPGKRWVGLRVIREGGYPVGFSESAIRNLLRLIDFLPSFYAIGALTMFIDRRSRRLGDLAAGTLVVKERRDVRLDSLGFDTRPQSAPMASGMPGSADGEESLPNLHRLTPSDQSVLREYLLRRPSLAPVAAASLASQLASAFCQKLEYELNGESPEQFLVRLAKQLHLRW